MEDDHQLIKRAQSGSAPAFNQLVELHYGNVYGQALRMLRSEDDAKDVAQLVFIKAWKKLPTFKFQSAFSSWLYRITAFTALDAIRKRDARKETAVDSEWLENCDESSPSEFALPEQIRSLERKELRQQYDQALQQLPSAQREALELRENEGLAYEEIARRLRCKTGTVMSRLFNARKTIQKHLKDFLT